MDTVAIVLIAVGAIALLALLYVAVLAPKRRAERRLAGQREAAADHHRELASDRQQHASVAEQKAEEARLEAKRAEQQAQLAREEASVHKGRADLHEQGLADHELEDGSGADPHAAATNERGAVRSETLHDEHDGTGRFRTEDVRETEVGQSPPPRT